MTIFQTEYISAVKFYLGNGKNRSIVLIPKSQKVLKHRQKKSEQAPLSESTVESDLLECPVENWLRQ